MDKAREAFRIADNDERIKRALKSRINTYTDNYFVIDDKVYFKEKDKLEWSGPASVLGQQGKVVFLKYGNNLRRVHMSKIIRVGEEYKSKKSSNQNTPEENKEPKDKTDSDEINSEITKEETTDENIANIRPQRKVAISRPDKNRDIIFRLSQNGNNWENALVKNVGRSKGTNQFLCTLLLDNSDQLIVDFSDGNYLWQYRKYPCDLCGRTFDTKRSFKLHNTKKHKNQNILENKTEDKLTPENDNKDETIIENKTVTFQEHEEVNFNENLETKAVKKMRVRFKEVMDERPRNETWINSKNQFPDIVQYAEIKETTANSEKVKEAKEKELTNFDDYKAYEEVEENGQEVLGTQFVLTEKPDSSIKARFVTKGFQESLNLPSDSPTSSR